MLYHPDGRVLVVQSPEQHQLHAEQGWQQTPLQVHHERPATHSPSLSSGEPLAILLRNVLEQVLDERGLTKAWVDGYADPAPLPELKLSKRSE